MTTIDTANAPLAAATALPAPTTANATTTVTDGVVARAVSRPAGTMLIDHVLELRSARRGRSSLARAFGISPLSADEEPWFVGAVGERAVGRQLARLSPEWTVLHSVPAPRSRGDIDHIVIGPGGMFTVNTKHHAGARLWVADEYILVEGRRVPYARIAQSEARKAASLAGAALPPAVAVRPVLAIVGARHLRVRSRSRLVETVDARDLRSWLESLPAVLDAATVARVALAVATGIDGSGRAGRSEEHAVSSARFDRLEREVTEAARCRGWWRLGGALGAIGIAWAAFAQLPEWLASQLG